MKPLELSPEDFRTLAAVVVALSAEFLSSVDTRPIFPRTSGAEVEQIFALDPPEHGMGKNAFRRSAGCGGACTCAKRALFRICARTRGTGRSIGRLVRVHSQPEHDRLASSPSGVTIERTVVRWLAEAIGCPGFLGTLTGGGSAANLMGLAMAREAKLPANERGLCGTKRRVIYASEQVHMAVPKAVAMLGIGRENLRYIACDEAYRMIPSQLEQAIRQDKAEGLTPVAVVASAGTVNTGAIDPLREIASVAHTHDVWMHVDGAYGALAAIAVPGKFDGLELVDSLSLDPHKWLYQPLDCGCLLYRDIARARQTFTYTGSYAKQLSADPIEGFAFFEESIELSRRFRGLKLWLSLRYHGLEGFRAAIRQDLEHAQSLAAAVDGCKELERLAPVELSAVCFRYLVRSGRQ